MAAMATRIVADVLIPGRGEPIEHGTVVMDSGSIDYAGPTAGAPAAALDDITVEAPVVMPGLWDCHTHFIGMATSNLEALATVDLVGSAARAVEDAGKVLDGGITSVRDVGGIGLRLAPVVAEGRMRGPTSTAPVVSCRPRAGTATFTRCRSTSPTSSPATPG